MNKGLNSFYRAALNHLYRKILKIFTRTKIPRTWLTASLQQSKLATSFSQFSRMVRQIKYSVDFCAQLAPISIISISSEQTRHDGKHTEDQDQVTSIHQIFHKLFSLALIEAVKSLISKSPWDEHLPEKVKAKRLWTELDWISHASSVP